MTITPQKRIGLYDNNNDNNNNNNKQFFAGKSPYTVHVIQSMIYTK